MRSFATELYERFLTMSDIFNDGGDEDQARYESLPTHGLPMRLVFRWAMNRKGSGLRDEMVELNGIEPSAS